MDGATEGHCVIFFDIHQFENLHDWKDGPATLPPPPPPPLEVSPMELLPDSSWLEKVRLESRLRSECPPPSDVLMEREELEEAEGERLSGANP